MGICRTRKSFDCLPDGVEFLHFLKRMFFMGCLLALASPAAWADWNSFIMNFGKNLLGKGGQTWQIASYDDRWTYFASKNGMT